jgi:hypothetical protein
LIGSVEPLTNGNGKLGGIQAVRASHLIIAVLLLGALAILLNAPSLGDYLPFDTHRIFVYFVFLINTVIAIIGLWTPHRAAWLTYLIASLTCLLLIGASTPISALWIFAKLLFR